MTETVWDQSYPPSVLTPTPPVVPVTGAIGGTPGSWVPANAYPLPASVAEANALGLSLGAPWTTGQYVVLSNASSTHTHWNGAGFASGNAPAPPPTITAVNPNAAPTSGGDQVIITGTGFPGLTRITFGGVAVLNGQANSETELAVTTPPHAAGVVDVVIEHPLGNATWPGFTYETSAEDEGE